MVKPVFKMKNTSHCRLAGMAALLALCLALGACEFSVLQEDLKKIEDHAHQYQGRILTPKAGDNGLVVVALGDLEGREISAFRVLAYPGSYSLFSDRRETYLFAFEDRNLDFRFEAGERYGWARGGEIVAAGETGVRDIDIVVGGPGDGPPPPAALLNRPLTENLYGNHDFHFGSVTALDHELFSLEQAKKGMWQPYSFIEDGGTGIHFQEPYDPQRVPVLFVHGVLGSPVNFEPLIANLDRERFQPWYVSYPSGFDMYIVSGGLLQFIEIVQRRHGFEKMHIVAHSMGGLAARAMLNLCRANGGCGYVKSLTTISTPWLGVESARSGVTWAPTVVPIWRDLDPDSEFITTLFDTPLPDDMPYHLLFGYRIDSLFPNESSDGVIGLSSQLREAAQAEAEFMRGYDEGHVSILANLSLAATLNELLR